MKTITVDVAIAGAGVAGLTTAVSVGEKGYSVALFEYKDGFGDAVKPFVQPTQEELDSGMPPPGGINGIFAVETEFQNSRHHLCTRKEVYQYLLEHAHWWIDPRLIADFVNRSVEVYKWLAKEGLKIETSVSYYPSAPFSWLFFDQNNPRLPEILGGKFKALTNCALFSNIEITEITKKDGRVCGLKGVDKNGEEIEVEAKAVVIATGEPGGMMFGGGEKLPASGLELAEAIGAERGRDMYSGEAMPDGYRMMDELGTSRQPTQLIVNKSAERFTCEEILKYLDEAGVNFANQKDGIVFTIFDETINKYHEENGWFTFFYGRGPQHPENTRALFEKCIADGAPCMFMADSVEELAVKMGLDPASLKKTVDEYNAICISGRDPLMKDVKFLIPLTKPPFYAVRLKAELKKNAGPLRPTPKLEIMDTSLNAIPGLYGAGGACSLINGELYTHRIAGSRATYGLVSGRILGESIPEYIEKNFR